MPSARTLSLLALAVAVLFPAEVFGDQEKGAGGLVWERPEPGLTQAREKRQPIFLVVPGKEPESFWATLESELFRSSRIRKHLRSFVPITVPVPAPKQVQEILGSVGNSSLLVLLDFRGKILQRWESKTPSRGVFTRELKSARLRNHQLAQRYADVEKYLERSRYALKIKKVRESVLAWLKAEEVPLPPDSEPAHKRVEVRSDLDQIYQKYLGEGSKLEEQGKWSEAVLRYEKMIKDFPFPKKIRELRRKITELWREMGG
ncbi:MAG: hypothetical protein V3T77_01285 [Planctomycetota bacterium]